MSLFYMNINIVTLKAQNYNQNYDEIIIVFTDEIMILIIIEIGEKIHIVQS